MENVVQTFWVIDVCHVFTVHKNFVTIARFCFLFCNIPWYLEYCWPWPWIQTDGDGKLNSSLPHQCSRHCVTVSLLLNPSDECRRLSMLPVVDYGSLSLSDIWTFLPLTISRLGDKLLTIALLVHWYGRDTLLPLVDWVVCWRHACLMKRFGITKRSRIWLEWRCFAGHVAEKREMVVLTVWCHFESVWVGYSTPTRRQTHGNHEANRQCNPMICWFSVGIRNTFRSTVLAMLTRRTITSVCWLELTFELWTYSWVTWFRLNVCHAEQILLWLNTEMTVLNFYILHILTLDCHYLSLPEICLI